MFDISEKLITEQSDEIFGVSQVRWEDSSWKQVSLVNDAEVISLSHAKVYVFSDSVFWTQLTECRWNPSGTFPSIHHIAAHQQSQRVHGQNGRSINIHRTNYLHVDVQ